jgi:putative spermidine/putrescine transport system ATP-binding protein
MKGENVSEFLTVADLCKNYNTKPVLDGINFTLNKGELLSIVGPSGAGKTTFLKILSGLEYPDCGTVRFSNGTDANNGTILVFQEYLLFPHMTVKQNLLFGLKARKMLDKKGRIEKVSDKNLKGETASFIRQTVKDFHITAVIVTHDLEEASIISDKLGIFLDGKLRQTGTVSELYQKPADLEVAAFLGPVNHIPSDILPYIETSVITPGKKDIYSRAQGMEILRDPDGPGLVKSIEHRGTYLSLSVKIKEREIIIHSFKNGFSQGDRVKIKLHSYFTNGGVN